MVYYLAISVTDNNCLPLSEIKNIRIPTSVDEISHVGRMYSRRDVMIL